MNSNNPALGPLVIRQDRDPDAIRFRIETMERILERSFRIPIVRIPVGLDALIGLVPVVGDVISTTLGAWILWEARNLGLSKFQMMRMAANVAIDAALGVVPIAGNVADFFWRSNSRNFRIIREHAERQFGRPTPPALPETDTLNLPTP